MPERYNSYRGGLVFEGVLQVQTPLHIGAGFDQAAPTKDHPDARVAPVLLGDGSLPVITSTGLKGAMRALVGDWRHELGPNERGGDRLFGLAPNKQTDTGGRAGCLIPSAALLQEPAGVEQRVEPAAMRSEKRGSYHAVRTAIDGAAGVPKDHLLFTAEMVAPGAKFKFRLRLQGDPDGLSRTVLDGTASLLGTLQKNGLRLGRGRGDGQGLVILEPTVAVTKIWVQGHKVETCDASKDWNKLIQDAPIFEEAGRVYTLKLSSLEPFLVMASRPEPDQLRSDEPGNENRALRYDANTPDLPGTSLMGALRARAEWLLRLRALRHESMANEDLLLAEAFGLTADEQRDEAFLHRFAQHIGKPEPEITGFAGLLTIERILMDQAVPKKISSVKLDRFTQSPMDTALFVTEAFLQPSGTVRLRLRERARLESDHHALQQYVEALLNDVTREGPRQGLMLGHGSNRGFGWFDVAEADGR